MKELSIEEKAKAYDEALKVLHKYDGVNIMFTQDLKEEMFPELKESEDEKMRRWIINYLDNKALNSGIIQEKTNIKNAIAWLEKQGNIDEDSYEIAENEKREFVEDGFIKCYADFQDFKEGETYWLEYVGNDNYNVRSDNLLGKTYHITPCQLYTIFKKQTWLEKQGEQKPVPKFKVGDTMRTLQEATDGYTDGMPVVVSIDEEYYHCTNELIAIKDQDGYEFPPMNKRQNPAWREEDEKCLENAIMYCEWVRDKAPDEHCYNTTTKSIDWLKSLKDTVQPQPQQEWGEEDEKMLNSIIHSADNHCYINVEERDWLKSIRPHNTWKPSDEQMEALEALVEDNNQRYFYTILRSLYEQLKKLK